MRPADDNDQAKSGCSKKHARKELTFDPVLDRMENHERENKSEQKEQARPRQRVPKAPLDRLAQPNHEPMVDESPDVLLCVRLLGHSTSRRRS